MVNSPIDRFRQLTINPLGPLVAYGDVISVDASASDVTLIRLFSGDESSSVVHGHHGCLARS